MKSAKQFVQELVADNKALFDASAMQARAYYDSKPSKEKLVDHFTGRMVNERLNMVEISKKIAELPADADPVELQLLTQQANDEAVHYQLVKEVVEHLTGEPVDLVKSITSWEPRLATKGASLLKTFNCQEDSVAMALYQMCAEGRSEVVWDVMADCIDDEFISSRYRKIARDEGFHANIGAWKMEQLADTPETQAHATELVGKMRKELYRISCAGTTSLPEARQLIEEAYGAL